MGMPTTNPKNMPSETASNEKIRQDAPAALRALQGLNALDVAPQLGLDQYKEQMK